MLNSTLKAILKISVCFWSLWGPEAFVKAIRLLGTILNKHPKEGLSYAFLLGQGKDV
ncbi:hypothetical protein SAMN00808754_3078 [Thermanaeromonas toyohensis ToBE]|uniref:Uncharacterized protein n=1 Tax=Thermanaeromonas toyohensis ToBE TaxID=698762 RepID=A0A1W1W305_9FIRM|nr:hypothetical protein SAMN00808754_3078 [Thermanaeromonas toyohensis ToBE]